MLIRLTNPDDAEAARLRLVALIDAQAEWFISRTEDLLETSLDASLDALRREELDLSLAQGRLILSSWSEQGTHSWKINAWEWTGDRLRLQTSRRMGAEQTTLELIPRASASAIAATVRAARECRCQLLAQLAGALSPTLKIERATLSPGIRRGQPGRYARIILRDHHERVAVTATVASAPRQNVDALLSAAVIWFTRGAERIRAPYLQQLWLVLEAGAVKLALQRIALLRDAFRSLISVFEIDDSWQQLRRVPRLERAALWKGRLARFPPVSEPQLSSGARQIMAHEPSAMDVVVARHGETLRYHGLPIARVRSMMGVDRIWFGTDNSRRRILDDTSRDDWHSLIDDLRRHRAPAAIDHRHALYRIANEAWLESLLRRDITKLDPGLIIAPLYAQFRTAPGGRLGVRPVDLLALREDGRLVVIELKVSEDREHVFQGADYWRRVEAHRRRGHIARAKLFGARKIRDQPPLVYLVAPTLRFHPAFALLARTIAPDIEMYRFEINETWRSGVRVMRRTRVN